MNPYFPGPSYVKVIMSLVNVSLKVWLLDMAYMLIFLPKKNVRSFCICKSYSHFFSKTTCECNIVLTRTVNILTTNEHVKLTMLWTTGPSMRKWAKWSEDKLKKKGKMHYGNGTSQHLHWSRSKSIKVSLENKGHIKERKSGTVALILQLGHWVLSR